MLILRYWWWALLMHVTTFKQQTMTEFFFAFVEMPYLFARSLLHTAMCSQAEIVGNGIEALRQGWKDNTVALPPIWVKQGFLALGAA